MKKTLGQNGLNFIANKYKELKELVGKKADKSEIITESEREEVKYLTDGYARYSLNEIEAKLDVIIDAMKQFPVKDDTLTPFMFAYDYIDNKITIPSGIDFPKCYAYQSWVFNKNKSNRLGFCSSNYELVGLENIAKTKKTDSVEALMSKNLATVFDSAYAKARTLGATDVHFVKKSSDISRCKTKGYNTSSTWQDLSTSRDLEDWIGDFDKRTRELKSGGGEYTTLDIPYNYKTNGVLNYRYFRIYKINGMVSLNVQADLQSLSSMTIPKKFAPKTETYAIAMTDWYYDGEKAPYRNQLPATISLESGGRIGAHFGSQSGVITVMFNVTYPAQD